MTQAPSNEAAGGPRAWVGRPARLALAIFLIPVLATHAALLLSIAEGHVPACIPYLEGCTSISRAARHGSANLLFKAAMLPAALLLFWYWRLPTVPGQTRPERAIRLLGVLGVVALSIYVLALGSDGQVYRWMRRHGVQVYFFATYLAQILATARLQRAGLPTAPLLQILALVLLLGIANVVVALLDLDHEAKDRAENVVEWWAALGLSSWFLIRGWQIQREARQGPGG